MHKVFYTLQDNIMDSLGFPASLRRQINNGVLQANKPDRQDTIWLRSVVAWHSWLSYEQHCIRYLRPGHDGDYEFLERHIPQLDYLIQTTVTENFRCDITAIAGMGCSRDSDREFSSIQDFAMKKCQALTIRLMPNIVLNMILCVWFDYHILCAFPAVQIRFLA